MGVKGRASSIKLQASGLMYGGAVIKVRRGRGDRQVVRIGSFKGMMTREAACGNAVMREGSMRQR